MRIHHPQRGQLVRHESQVGGRVAALHDEERGGHGGHDGVPRSGQQPAHRSAGGVRLHAARHHLRSAFPHHRAHRRAAEAGVRGGGEGGEDAEEHPDGLRLASREVQPVRATRRLEQRGPVPGEDGARQQDAARAQRVPAEAVRGAGGGGRRAAAAGDGDAGGVREVPAAVPERGDGDDRERLLRVVGAAGAGGADGAGGAHQGRRGRGA